DGAPAGQHDRSAGRQRSQYRQPDQGRQRHERGEGEAPHQAMILSCAIAEGWRVTTSALILRSAPQGRVSKDAPARTGAPWVVLRDAAARPLRMRAGSERRLVIAPAFPAGPA